MYVAPLEKNLAIQAENIVEENLNQRFINDDDLFLLDDDDVKLDNSENSTRSSSSTVKSVQLRSLDFEQEQQMTHDIFNFEQEQQTTHDTVNICKTILTFTREIWIEVLI